MRLWAEHSGLSAEVGAANKRMQAPRPRPRLIGGRKVAHHSAVLAAITVVGARLKRSVDMTSGVKRG